MVSLTLHIAYATTMIHPHPPSGGCHDDALNVAAIFGNFVGIARAYLVGRRELY